MSLSLRTFFLWVCLLFAFPALAQESNCSNGLDDDGDGLVDSLDPDCPDFARVFNCAQANVCYLPPIYANSSGAASVFGTQDLVLSTSAPVAKVTIRTQDNSFTRTVIVTNTGSTLVSLPLSVVQTILLNNAQSNKGLIVSSDQPVQVTYRQTATNNQDIVPLKCEGALGQSFYPASQTRLRGTTSVLDERHFISVMATQPNTVVTINRPAGSTLTFAGISSFPHTTTLQVGQTYMVASNTTNATTSVNQTVSGVLVTATQPIVVNSGSQHTPQPYTGNRDAGIDQLVPIRSTGTSYVAMHGQNTTANADYLIVIATENGTNVTISGPLTNAGPSTTLSTTALNAAQVYTYNLPNTPNRAFTVNTNKRVYVYHVSSYAQNEYGMGLLPNITNCNGSRQIDFYRTSGSSADQAVALVPTSAVAGLRFRGQAYTVYGSVVDNVTVGGIAYSVVSFPNSSIAAVGVANRVSASDRIHVGVMSGTGGATGNFGFYSNYDVKVDVANPRTGLPASFYSVAKVPINTATPHCLTLSSCGSNNRISSVAFGPHTQNVTFSGSCITYTMSSTAPICARDTIRVNVLNDTGQFGSVCLEFVNQNNDLIADVLPQSFTLCQPGQVRSLSVTTSPRSVTTTPSYEFEWIAPDKTFFSTSIVSSSAIGQFQVTVIDRISNCRDTASAVTYLDSPSIAIGSGPTTVCTNTVNTYTVQSTTGTYAWNLTGGVIVAGGTPTSQSATIRWTGTGTLRVVLTSPIGCTAAVSLTPTIRPGLSLTASTQPILCNGTSTGVIDLSVTGGATPYSYTWSNGATSEDLTAVGVGSYTVSASDRNGCVSGTALVVSLTQPAALSIAATPTNVSCFGQTNGAIAVVVSGGTPYTSGAAYRYVWNTGATSQNLSGVGVGSYTVTVRDANGCSQTAVTTVTQPLTLSITAIRTPIACFGGATGAITLTPAGGAGSNQYRWNDNVLTQNRTGLVAGTYSVTVTDANNCTVTNTYSLTQPSTLSLVAAVTSARCQGSSTGAIDLTPTGGAQPYATYRWSNAANTQDVSGLVAGTYSVTVTDANGCSSTLSATVSQPAALVPQATLQHPTCFAGTNGVLTLGATGGTAPYGVLWAGGNTSLSRTGLVAGMYSATLTDAANCTVTTTVSLTQPPVLTGIVAQTNVSCFSENNGRISLTVSGGTSPYGYAWSNGASTSTVSGLIANAYSVTVTDANGCQLIRGVTISEPPSLVLSAATVDVLCPNQSPSGSIATQLSGGTQPYNYLWSNGSTGSTVEGLPAGSYTLIVTDVQGCTASLATTIVSPPPFALGLEVIPVACNAGATGSINLTVTGGTAFTTGAPYRYAWSNGATSQSVSGLIAGTYSATVLDASGCAESVTVSVSEPPVLQLTESHTNLICNGVSTGSVSVSVAGGTSPYSYSWTDGATTPSRASLAAGSYSVRVTDTQGCTATQTISLTQPPALSVSRSVSGVSCFSTATGQISLSASGGTGAYTYAWNTGANTALLTSLTAGVYSATLTDAASCSLTLAQLVTQPPALTASFVQQDIRCFGSATGQISVQVSGGTSPYSFVWNDANTGQNRTGLVAGVYSVTVSDANSCQQVLSVTLTQAPALTLLTQGVAVSCTSEATGSISTTATGGTGSYGYLWSDLGNTNPTRTGLAAGTYSVTLTDANGCQTSQSVSLTQPSALSTALSLTHVACADGSTGSINLSVTGGSTPYSFTWSDGNSGQNRTTLPAGTYVVQVMDQNGCRVTATASLTQPQPLRLFEVVTNVVCNGGINGQITLTASGGTSPYSFTWNDSNTNQNRSNLTAGTYSVTATDGQGCTQSLSTTVSQPLALSMGLESTTILCAGGANGAVSLTIAGGSTPYTYLWSNGANTQSLSGLVAGNYSVTATDNAGCPITDASTLAEPMPLVLTPTPTNNLCQFDQTGQLALNVTGGTAPYTYTWNTGSNAPSLTGLSVGRYTVTVTDVQNCVASVSSTLTAPSTLSVQAQVSRVGCFSGATGTINVTATGGVSPYEFNWTQNDGNLGLRDFTAASGLDGVSNLKAGYYTLFVTDLNGCTQNRNYFVQEPDFPLSATAGTRLEVCPSDGSGGVSLSLTGGTTPYAYQWTNGATTQSLTLVTTGSFSVVVTDAAGCTATAASSFSYTPFGIRGSTSVICAGGTVLLEAVGCDRGVVVWWTGHQGPTLEILTTQAQTAVITARCVSPCQTGPPAGVP